MGFGPEMLFFEFVLPFLVPPLLGGIIGWVIGSVLQKPRRAVTGGIIGGVVGGWVGVGLYRLVFLPSGDPSLIVWSAYVLIGAFVGSVIVALVVARRNTKE